MAQHGRCMPWMMAVALLAVGLAARPARGQESEIPTVGLGEPFVLAKGETMQVGPEGFEVTLRSVDDDSGCMTPKDCSVMVFKGILVLRLDEKKQMQDVDASFFPDRPVIFTFAGHEIYLTAVQKVKDRVDVSFKVVQASEEEKEGE